MSSFVVIYGPRRSGKTTKLLDIAASQPDSTKRIVLATYKEVLALKAFRPELDTFTTPIISFNPAGLDTDKFHIYLDDINAYPLNRLNEIFIRQWKSITVTGGIKNVQSR